MTSVRQSFAFALEDAGFGKGKLDTTPWTAVPPGTFIQTTQQREVTRVNTSGSKFFDTVAYGMFRGKWDWSFVLDYNYLEPLLLAFDSYTCTPMYRENDDSDWIEGDAPSSAYETCYEHTFDKVNGNRVPSFTIRRVLLHGIAGNDDVYPDEVGIIKGCVCEQIRFTQASGSSQMNVQMSGFYVNEEMHRVNLLATDYAEYENEDGLIEYFCLFFDQFADDYYVANTESFGLDVGLSTAAISNTCCPFSQQFYEGFTTYQLNTSCYANDPKRYKERVFRGGKADTSPSGKLVTPDVRNGDYSASRYMKTTTLNKLNGLIGSDGYMMKPACKELAPMDEGWAISYNLCKEYIPSSEPSDASTSLTTAISRSDKLFAFHITKCVMKSATWQKGEGSKLYDQLSSAECRKVDITIRNNSGRLATVTSHGTAAKFLTHQQVSKETGQTNLPGEPYGVHQEAQPVEEEPTQPTEG